MMKNNFIKELQPYQISHCLSLAGQREKEREKEKKKGKERRREERKGKERVGQRKMRKTQNLIPSQQPKVG